MLKIILIITAIALVWSLGMRLMMWSRKREIDIGGNPMLRFIASPYLIFVIGLGFCAVGVYQWLVPFNDQHSGNLILLSYLPLFISFISMSFAVYLWNFRVILKNNIIYQKRWPLPSKEFKLNELEKIEQMNHKILLRFVGDRKLVIYDNMMSGSEYFINQIQR